MSEVALPIRAELALPLAERFASDEWLARLVQRGNTRAFAALYERHHRALSRYCRSIVRDEQDAEDALQSAMTRAFAALSTGEREIAVRPWLFRIVHNEAISLLRRRRREDAPIDEQLPTTVSVEGTVEQRERLATLVADLQTLAERQRAALVMRELSGLSIEEIAAALATSPGAAKQALFEARCALHELAEGRTMECDVVRHTLSERDGRVLRGRKLRAHLRACAGCREFGALTASRGADLRMLAPPLPAAAASTMLARLLSHGAGGHGGGTAAAASTGTVGAHAAASSLAAKALAGAALLTAATAGTVQLTSSHPGRGHDSLTAAHTAEPTHAATVARTLTTRGPLHGGALAIGQPSIRKRSGVSTGAGAVLSQTTASNEAPMPQTAGAERVPQAASTPRATKSIRGSSGAREHHARGRHGASGTATARSAPRHGGAPASAHGHHDHPSPQSGSGHSATPPKEHAAPGPPPQPPGPAHAEPAGGGQSQAHGGEPAETSHGGASAGHSPASDPPTHTH